MLSYRLTLYEKGVLLAVENVKLAGTAAILAAIPDLFAKHPRWDVIQVYAGLTHLFSVDCTGATIAE